MAEKHHPGGNPAFEKKVLESLERLEQGQALAAEELQVIDNKIDLLTAMVRECCEEHPPPPRPTGVRIDQIQ